MYNFKIEVSKKAILIIGLFAAIGWTFAFSMMNRIPREEVLQIFIVAQGIPANAIENKLSEMSTPFKKIVEIYVAEEEHHFMELFLTQGLLESDVLVVPKSLLDQFNLANDFHVIDLALMRQFGLENDVYTYVVEQTIYGLYVTEQVDPSLFPEIIYNGDYVICLNKNSSIDIEKIYEAISLLLGSS